MSANMRHRILTMSRRNDREYRTIEDMAEAAETLNNVSAFTFAEFDATVKEKVSGLDSVEQYYMFEATRIDNQHKRTGVLTPTLMAYESSAPNAKGVELTVEVIAPSTASSFSELERSKVYRNKSARNKDRAVGVARVAAAETAMAASAVPIDATIERTTGCQVRQGRHH